MANRNLYALALALVVFIQLTQAVDQLPAAVTAYSASREQRYHHNLFHNVRMSYLQLDPTQQISLEDLGWRPPRPAYAYNSSKSQIVMSGDAGEDFLYMHRQMIAAVNSISAEAESTWRVVGWPACPAPGDESWPVPPTYSMPGQEAFQETITDYKTDDYYWNTIVPAEAWFDDSDNLRTLSLGDLGSQLEFGLHTWFHLRFSAANPIGYRVQAFNPTTFVSEKWDVAAYDWLADFYSAHVNPYFWKIHGWIESKISAWQAANGVQTIRWIGKWQGGPMSVLDDLYKVARIADETGHDGTTDEDDDSDLGSEVTIDRDTLEEVINLLLHASQRN